MLVYGPMRSESPCALHFHFAVECWTAWVIRTAQRGKQTPASFTFGAADGLCIMMHQRSINPGDWGDSGEYQIQGSNW